MRFSTIFTVRSLKSLFELLRSLLLKSLKSGPLRARFCQFAQSAPLFASRSAIAPKMKVRSRAKSDWAISKSDMPSSENNRTLKGELYQRSYVILLLIKFSRGKPLAIRLSIFWGYDFPNSICWPITRAHVTTFRHTQLPTGGNIQYGTHFLITIIMMLFFA